MRDAPHRIFHKDKSGRSARWKRAPVTSHLEESIHELLGPTRSWRIFDKDYRHARTDGIVHLSHRIRVPKKLCNCSWSGRG